MRQTVVSFNKFLNLLLTITTSHHYGVMYWRTILSDSWQGFLYTDHVSQYWGKSNLQLKASFSQKFLIFSRSCNNYTYFNEHSGKMQPTEICKNSVIKGSEKPVVIWLPLYYHYMFLVYTAMKKMADPHIDFESV